MALFQTLWFLLLTHLVITQSFPTNQYITSIDPDGTHRWESTTDFVPIQGKSFGSIPIGEIMQIEFDFIWHGRTNEPETGKYEMFFRVGFNATSNGCDGQGSRYPSFWLTGNANTLHVSVSSGPTCQPSQSLNNYGIITIGVSYHVRIFFNSTLLIVDITNGNKPPFTQVWPRQPTQSKYIGTHVPVWWMSHRFGTEQYYNRGNATFSNVELTSFTPGATHTHTPTVTPTNMSPSPTYVATLTPITMPTTQTPTISPTIIRTDFPSEFPTVQPTHIPTNTPTFYPTQMPTLAPSKSPIVAPTMDSTNPTETPSTLNPTYNPSYMPTIDPTYNPSAIPTHAPLTTSIPTSPTNIPTARPTFGYRPWTTTTPYIEDTYLVIENVENKPSEESKYEIIEITIFVTVIALCVCTVFTFLAYLMFKSKVKKIRLKRSEEKLQKSPIYHMELNGREYTPKSTLHSEIKSEKSKNYKLTVNQLQSPRKNRHYLSKSLRSPSKTASRKHCSKSLHSPSKTTENLIDSIYLSLGRYKSDSLPNHSHLSISAMHMGKDATPTPAVSPNENYDDGHRRDRNIISPQTITPNAKPNIIRNITFSNDERHRDISALTVTLTPTNDTNKERDFVNIETVGFDDSDSEEQKERPKIKVRKKSKGGYDILAGSDDMHIKREKKKFTPREYEHEIEEPYEEYIDDPQGYGMYTTPMANVNGRGRYRKGTETTEGYDSDKGSDHTDHVKLSSFYDTYGGGKGNIHHKNSKNHYKGNGYEWIKKTLRKVDKQYYDSYLLNFETHKVQDNRLKDLLNDDWKELLPSIGPRNHFRRLFQMNLESNLFLGEFEYDEETTVNTTVNNESVLSDQNLFNSFVGNDRKDNGDIHNNNNPFTPSKSPKSNEEFYENKANIINDPGLTFTSDTHLRPHIVNAPDSDDKILDSLPLSPSYVDISEEKQSEIIPENEENNLYKRKLSDDSVLDPLPSHVTIDSVVDLDVPPHIFTNEFDKVQMDTIISPMRNSNNLVISPPISPASPQAKYEKHNLIRNQNRRSKHRKSSKSKSTSVSVGSMQSMSSSIPPPIPDECDPKELSKPLMEESSDSGASESVLGIPKFEADIDSSDDSESETESDVRDEIEHQSKSRNETDSYSEPTESKSVKVFEEEELYEEDSDDEEVSIDLGKSSSDEYVTEDSD